MSNNEWHPQGTMTFINIKGARILPQGIYVLKIAAKPRLINSWNEFIWTISSQDLYKRFNFCSAEMSKPILPYSLQFA